MTSLGGRRRASGLIRMITGFPDRAATIGWQQVTLPDRVLRVRVHRPAEKRVGGFVGTAVQSDWINSHLAG